MDPAGAQSPGRRSGARKLRWRAGWLAIAVAACVPGARAQPAARPADPAAARAATPMSLGALLTEARRDLDRGDAAAVHRRLTGQVQWYAGLPEFDYLLGLAALDAGHPGQAVLALERVLTVEPAHLQARAELARALLAIREREAARREFETVAAARIPPDVRRIIDRYLAQIAVGEQQESQRVQGFVELGFGWDSNVSLGSASDRWLLANGIAVIPEPSILALESQTISAAAGLAWRLPIGGGWQWTAGAQVSHRANPQAHTLDQTLLDASGGVEYRSDCHTVTMLGQLQHLRVDDTAFRNAGGVLAQWRCEVDPRTQIGAYVQHFDMHFPDQDIRNARRDVIGGTLARSFDGALEPVLVASLYSGRERPRTDVPQLRYRFSGIRAVISAALDATKRGWLAASWEGREFAGEEPLFAAVREDRQTEVRMGVDHRIDRAWSLTPQIAYTRNASTLAPNDFKRTQVQLAARYSF